MKKVDLYLDHWRACGYPDDIPDEVPDALMRLNLAPSWKAIAIAILKNDLHFTTLGFSVPPSKWYSVLKKIELESRGDCKNQTMRLFD